MNANAQGVWSAFIVGMVAAFSAANLGAVGRNWKVTNGIWIVSYVYTSQSGSLSHDLFK